MTGDEKGGEKGEEGERAREGGREGEGERGKEGEGQKRVRRKKQRNFLVGNIPTIYHLQHATPTTPPQHAPHPPRPHTTPRYASYAPLRACTHTFWSTVLFGSTAWEANPTDILYSRKYTNASWNPGLKTFN